MVTSVNEPEMCFYELLGFTRTGHTEPYPNDSSILEYEVSSGDLKTGAARHFRPRCVTRGMMIA